MRALLQILPHMYVELGKIVGIWGVKGWIKLHSYTRNRVDIANYPRWWLQAKGGQASPLEFQLLDCREQGQGIVAHLDGINDRDQAQALIGRVILIAEQDLAKLPEGEFYWQQLIGLNASNLQGESMGKVESILETGANDVLVLSREGETGIEEVLIPYVPQVVKKVDLAQGTMIVDWDLGYLA